MTSTSGSWGWHWLWQPGLALNPLDAGLGQLMTFWENLPVAAELAESRE